MFNVLKCKSNSVCNPLRFLIEAQNRGNRDPTLATPGATSPKKNTGFCAWECFHPWIHAFPKCYSPLPLPYTNDVDMMMTLWQDCPWTFACNLEVFKPSFDDLPIVSMHGHLPWQSVGLVEATSPLPFQFAVRFSQEPTCTYDNLRCGDSNSLTWHTHIPMTDPYVCHIWYHLPSIYPQCWHIYHTWIRHGIYESIAVSQWDDMGWFWRTGSSTRRFFHPGEEVPFRTVAYPLSRWIS